MTGVATPYLRIPDFSLPASTGQTLSFESYRDKIPLVLIFTPDLKSSLKILQPFNDHLADFGGERSQVLVAAKETASEVRAVAKEHQLVLPILADASGSMARELNLEFASHPVVLVADKQGRIRESIIYPDAHVDGILDRVRRLRTET